MNEDNKNEMKIKEFDVLSLFKRVLAEKRLLAIYVIVFAIIGIIYALNKQKEYTSSVVLAPEVTSMGMSQNMSDLAGMVGLNVGGSGNSVDAIYPEIYPDVFASTDFIVKLFNVPVTLSKSNIQKTYFQHLKTDIKTPFWNYPQIWLLKLFSKKKVEYKASKTINPDCLTKEQDNICQTIRGNIGCQLNKGTSVITITVTDVDPQIASCIADTLQNRLQEYITLYRTKKARNDLMYARKLNEEAKADYTRARQIYASYSDANTDVILQSYHSKIEDLENEMQLKFNNYSETTRQVQQALAKVQENTPAFTIIQRAIVPLKASSTPRSMMVLIFIFLGCFIDAFWILVGRNFFINILRKNK
jgi:uncharacterized protein involved in exopolysaccharide biosynthesis